MWELGQDEENSLRNWNIIYHYFKSHETISKGAPKKVFSQYLSMLLSDYFSVGQGRERVC